jgi:hypothetical protein
VAGRSVIWLAVLAGLGDAFGQGSSVGEHGGVVDVALGRFQAEHGEHQAAPSLGT